MSAGEFSSTQSHASTRPAATDRRHGQAPRYGIMAAHRTRELICVLLATEREELAAAGRRLATRGLVIGTAGNLSVRRGDLIAVTPTGGVLAALTAEQMTVIDFNGAVVEGALPPTSEVALHTLVYRSTPAGAVAHAHALASTAVACAHDELPVTHYMQLLLGGPVRVAPFATFGTAELARHVCAALDGRVAALMANHGSIAYGSSLGEACDRLELLEWCAELHARCLALGTPRPLSRGQLDAVMEAMTTRGYGAATPRGKSAGHTVAQPPTTRERAPRRPEIPPRSSVSRDPWK